MCFSGCARRFFLRLKEGGFGAGEKLVGSTICRLLTRPGAARCSSAKTRDKQHLKKCRIRHGCARTSGRFFRGFSGCFHIARPCCARGRRAISELVALPRAVWAHGDTRLGRGSAAWRWRSGQSLESVLDPQTCPSALSQRAPSLSQTAK